MDIALRILNMNNITLTLITEVNRI
jgi:hypothetical protein